MFWRRRKLTDDLKAVTEVAGEQIAPGAGTLFLVLGAALAAGATAYYVNRVRKQKAKGPAPADQNPNKKAAP
jgi:hypothetical protein